MPATSVADELRALFAQHNLTALAEVLLNLKKQGVGDNELELRLQETAEWKQRFAGNELRRQKGWRVLSAGEYLAKEESIRTIMQEKYGLPKGFYDDPSDFAKAIGANLGGQEMDERLAQYKAVVTDGAATGVLAYAQSQYGLGTGDLIAYWIDPDRAQNVLNKVAAASRIGAAAARTGFGAVSRAEAERLDALGVTATQAEQGFSQAAGMAELAQDVGGSEGVTRGDLTAAIFDQDAAAQRRVTRKQSERRAGFQGGGGYAESRTGFAGLGSANT